MDTKSITCKACDATFYKEDAQRNCSNCFACTGCIKYICPKCGEVYIEKEVKKAAIGGQK